MSEPSTTATPSATYQPPQFDTPDLAAFRRSWIEACWATCALAIIVVGLRLFARATKRGSAGWDDWTIVIALLLAIGDAVSNTFQNVCATFSPCFSRASITSEELNTLSLGFMRLSVCIFVLRLLPPNSRMAKYATWFAIGLNFAATMVCIGVFAALNPYSSNTANTTHSISIALNRTFTAAGILSILTDFITVVTPVFVIHAIQLNLRTKLGAIAIICLGLVTACLSVGKLIATKQTSHNMPINIVRIQILADLEQNLGIIFASCPALRQLYGLVEKRLKSSKAAPSDSNPKSGDSSGSAKVTPLVSGASQESKFGAKSVAVSRSLETGSGSTPAGADPEKGRFNHNVDMVDKHKAIDVRRKPVADPEDSTEMMNENTSRYWGDRVSHHGF